MRPAVIFEVVRKDAGHLERRGGNSGNGHQGIVVDGNHLVAPLVHDGITRSGTAVSGNDHAILEMEGHHGRALKQVGLVDSSQTCNRFGPGIP